MMNLANLFIQIHIIIEMNLIYGIISLIRDDIGNIKQISKTLKGSISKNIAEMTALQVILTHE